MSSSKDTGERDRPASEGEADIGGVKKRVRRRRGGQRRYKPYQKVDPATGASNEATDMPHMRRSARSVHCFEYL